MKINHIGRLNVNPYNKQMEKMEKTEKAVRKDKIEISTEALELQKMGDFDVERQEKIEALRQKVNSGEYEINAKEVAKKMYSYWSELI
ncbi:flagellar biosynthesis anti-sigma factor FlgM [Bacillus sp. CGMCC 1.16607]|uniref:flagellar biosynthesis anti-sigma factor FlgM n=1 Tax=Bacillus sp. CGMCC 1.16607 TaxID=3351842 RepID=UPI003629FBDB